jgi:hypothetical protein
MPPFGGFGGFEVNKPQTTHFRPNFISPPNLPVYSFMSFLGVFLVLLSPHCRLVRNVRGGFGKATFSFFFFGDGGAIGSIITQR